MKLGIIMAPEAASFQRAKDLGLDFVEFDMNPVEFFGKSTDEYLAVKEDVKKASEETGIEVGAVGRWASKIIDTNGEVIEDELNSVKAVIDLGAYWGAKHYLVSCNYVPELSYYKNITASIKALNIITKYAADKGMKTAIVNCMMGNNYIRTPEQWKLVLDEVPGLGIKYDPSHSFVHGGENGDYMHESMGWGDRFTYCHIKGVIQGGESQEEKHWALRDLVTAHPELHDNFMNMLKEDSKWYDNPPAGIDSINWRAFFAALYKYDYDGYLAIEPHSATWQGEKGEKGIKYTIKYIRDLMI